MHAESLSPAPELSRRDAGMLQILVDDLITLNAEGGATRSALMQKGWPQAYLDANIDRASAEANKRFVRQLDSAPRKSVAELTAEMADIIGSLLPPTQIVVAELSARGYCAADIDRALPKARAQAALNFAHGRTGWAN